MYEIEIRELTQAVTGLVNAMGDLCELVKQGRQGDGSWEGDLTPRVEKIERKMAIHDRLFKSGVADLVEATHQALRDLELEQTRLAGRVTRTESVIGLDMHPLPVSLADRLDDIERAIKTIVVPAAEGEGPSSIEPTAG